MNAIDDEGNTPLLIAVNGNEIVKCHKYTTHLNAH